MVVLVELLIELLTVLSGYRWMWCRDECDEMEFWSVDDGPALCYWTAGLFLMLMRYQTYDEGIYMPVDGQAMRPRIARPSRSCGASPDTAVS